MESMSSCPILGKAVFRKYIEAIQKSGKVQIKADLRQRETIEQNLCFYLGKSIIIEQVEPDVWEFRLPTGLAPEITPLGVIWSFRCRYARIVRDDRQLQIGIDCDHPSPCPQTKKFNGQCMRGQGYPCADQVETLSG